MWTIKEMNMALRRNGIHNIKILSKKVKSYKTTVLGFGLYRISGNTKELLLEHDFNMTTLLHNAANQNILSKQTVEKIIKTYRNILSIKLPSNRMSDDWVYVTLYRNQYGSVTKGPVYFIHIDPLIFSTGLNHFDIHRIAFNNDMISVIRPEDYENTKITAEMILTLDENNNIKKQIIPSKYT